jgi:hypothetical protein
MQRLGIAAVAMRTATDHRQFTFARVILIDTVRKLAGAFCCSYHPLNIRFGALLPHGQ